MEDEFEIEWNSLEDILKEGYRLDVGRLFFNFFDEINRVYKETPNSRKNCFKPKKEELSEK